MIWGLIGFLTFVVGIAFRFKNWMRQSDAAKLAVKQKEVEDLEHAAKTLEAYLEIQRNAKPGDALKRMRDGTF